MNIIQSRRQEAPDRKASELESGVNSGVNNTGANRR